MNTNSKKSFNPQDRENNSLENNKAALRPYANGPGRGSDFKRVQARRACQKSIGNQDGSSLFQTTPMDASSNQGFSKYACRSLPQGNCTVNITSRVIGHKCHI